MITDTEFVVIRSFDRTLVEGANEAQAIINRKNALLVKLAAENESLRAQLAAETGKRRMAELQLAQASRQ